MSDFAKIYVPQPVVPEAMAILETVGTVEVLDTDRMPTRDELRAGFARNDYVFIIGDLPISDELLEASSHLKGIAFGLTMPEVFIDLATATRLKIPVTRVHVYSWIDSTADLTATLILALHWRLVEADHYTRCGRFRQEMSTDFLCVALPGKVVGMVGLGRVGQLVVPRLRPFGLEVVYTKRQRLGESLERELGVRWIPTLDELLQISDVVSIHASYNESTDGLLGAREFGLMKTSAFLVNTARGWIVDEPALAEALKSGEIAGAGLDVFAGEPPVVDGVTGPDPALLPLRNVILLPHIGGNTDRVLTDMTVEAADNLAALVRGQRPEGIVNPEIYQQGV